MKKLSIALVLTLISTNVFADSRVLCYDRFDDEIWEMTGEHYDDKTCKAMMIAGTVGLCFEGEASEVAEMMNNGVFEYSRQQKINSGTAVVESENLIQFSSYEGDYVGWTRDDAEMFRCPEFENIKDSLTALADELESSTDYAVTRRYREEFGMPAWLK